jgi:hypothetical protein
VVFVCYQESLEFAGFSSQKISELFPELSNPIAQGKYPVTPRFTVEETIAILAAERSGTLEPSKREIVAELRNRSKFPYAWQVETKQANKTRLGVSILLIEAGLVGLIQGGIALLAWMVRGFVKEV